MVTFSCSDLDGVASCTSPQTRNADGANQVVTGQCVDSLGNTATANVTVNIDKTPPNIQITSPQNGATLENANQVSVTGSVTESGSGTQVFMCGGSDVPLSGGTFAYNAVLGSQTNDILCESRDLADNTGFAHVSVTLSDAAPQRTFTLDATGDTTISSVYPDQNDGAQTNLGIAEAPDMNNVLVKFSLDDLKASLGSSTVVSANLQLYVESNGGNWGAGGILETHRMLTSWDETIATWNCATSAGCQSQWNGGLYALPPTSMAIQTNAETGWKSFDVTTDVGLMIESSEHFGWLLRKRSYSGSGSLFFTSLQGTPDQGPRLVIRVEDEMNTASALTLAAADPHIVPADGQTHQVSIHGTGFYPAMQLYVYPSTAQAGDPVAFTYIDETEISLSVIFASPVLNSVEARTSSGDTAYLLPGLAAANSGSSLLITPSQSIVPDSSAPVTIRLMSLDPVFEDGATVSLDFVSGNCQNLTSPIAAVFGNADDISVTGTFTQTAGNAAVFVDNPTKDDICVSNAITFTQTQPRTPGTPLYTCTTGLNSVVVSPIVNLPPTQLTAGQTYPTSPNSYIEITMRNTGSETWSYGKHIKLGAIFRNWSTNRIYITPSTVTVATCNQTGSTYTFKFHITAPPGPGTYSFQYRLLDEDTAQWFGGYAPGPAGSPLQIKVVSASTNCPVTHPNDQAGDIQSCLDAVPDTGGVVNLAPGVYTIKSTLSITRDKTVLTTNNEAGTNPDCSKDDGVNCAKLMAGPDLWAPILDVKKSNNAAVKGFAIQYLVVDGNKMNRTQANQCYTLKPDHNRKGGSNIRIKGENFSVHNISSRNALCGTGLSLQGSNYEIAYNTFLNNGYTRHLYGGPEGPGAEPWSDGITLSECTNTGGGAYSVHDNTIYNASDVSIVDGGGDGCRVHDNTMQQKDSLTNAQADIRSFAGIHVANFPHNGNGTHKGSQFKYNHIYGKSSFLLDFGINAGYHSWGPCGDLWITHMDSAVISRNDITQANAGVVVDGVCGGSTSTTYGKVSDNNISSLAATDHWSPGWSGCHAGYLITSAHNYHVSVPGATNFQFHNTSVLPDPSTDFACGAPASSWDQCGGTSTPACKSSSQAAYVHDMWP
jgi:hypothetical protein